MLLLLETKTLSWNITVAFKVKCSSSGSGSNFATIGCPELPEHLDQLDWKPRTLLLGAPVRRKKLPTEHQKIYQYNILQKIAFLDPFRWIRWLRSCKYYEGCKGYPFRGDRMNLNMKTLQHLVLPELCICNHRPCLPMANQYAHNPVNHR